MADGVLSERKGFLFMGKREQLQHKLQTGQDILSTTIANVGWSGLVQKMSKTCLDFVLFDLEHGTQNIEQIEGMLRVARLCGLPTIVRVGDVVPHLISKTVDMGADGILLPRVESAEQVATAISSLRFFPAGRKGCGGFSLFYPEESPEDVNRNRMLLIQIESDEGISALEEILKSYGDELAGVLIGPYDMSIMSGVPLQVKHEAMLERIRSVFRTCKTYGMSCGIFIDGPEDLLFWKSLGANIFWTGTELSLYFSALEGLCNSFQRMEEGDAR